MVRYLNRLLICRIWLAMSEIAGHAFALVYWFDLHPLLASMGAIFIVFAIAIVGGSALVQSPAHAEHSGK